MEACYRASLGRRDAKEVGVVDGAVPPPGDIPWLATTNASEL